MSTVPLSVEHLLVQCFTYCIPGEADITWCIEIARDAVKRGMLQKPEPVAISAEESREIALRNGWGVDHLDDVDCNEPGIAAPIIEEGKIVYILIDGQHRNARAARDGLPFSAYLLTDEGSRRAVISDKSHPRLP